MNKDTNATRTTIADLPTVGSELPDEHLEMAVGGLICDTYCAHSSTQCNDVDGHWD